MKTFDNNLNPKSPLPPPTLRDIDASFSSYLIPEKPNTCQPHHHHHPNHNHHTTAGSGRCSSRDDSTSELSIFDAHKYFNEVTNIQKLTTTTSSNNNNSSRVSPVVVNVIPEATRYSSASSASASASVSSSVEGYSGIRNYRARSFHAATPTASSEASWNSKQGLLSHPPGAISVSMRNPPNPNPNEDLNNNNKLRTSLSKPIRHLRRKCKCPCTDKKSVQVNEKTTTELPKTKKMPSPPPPPQEITHNWVHVEDTPPTTTTTTTTNLVATKSQRFPMVTTTVRVPFTDGFTFPVLNPHPNGVVSEEDLPRDSLEVFRPPDEVAVVPKPLSFPFPPAKSGDDNGDSASDASSDLFEIESFSTTGGATQSACPTAILYRRSSRDSFDEGSAMTECYEPSEASIEWSVTTAEGYDDSGGRGGGGAAAAEQWKRRGGNGLLVMSCRGEKAVSVGPQPVKCGEEGQIGATSAWRHVNGVSTAAGNISSIISTSSGRVITGSGSVNKPPLARSHRNTPRVKSLPFAT